MTAYLSLGVDEADPLLVDGDEEQLWIGGVGDLLDLEEGGAEGGPAVDDLEEGDLGLIHRHPRVLVVRLHDLLLPLLKIFIKQMFQSSK